MKKLIFIILIFVTADARAQWPGAFYIFELKGPDGKNIDSASISEYKLTIDSATNKGPSGIEICPNSKLWRFYKGDKNLYVTNLLIIEKLSDGTLSDKMIIKFPPPMTGGREKYYANLYAGVFTFKSGTYTIKLPKDADEWNALKEVELCPQTNNYNMYLDISKFQK